MGDSAAADTWRQRVRDLEPASTPFGVSLGVIAAAIMAEVAIVGGFKRLSRGQAVELDERDHAIEARANTSPPWTRRLRPS